MRKSKKLFTLVELLIAMAVLVVMMGFLLTFTSGAQRIWTATTTEDNAFQDAQILMQVLTDDLENMLFTTQQTNPDDYSALYVNKTANQLTEACWLTSGYEGGSPKYVIYQYDSSANKIYRTLVENDTGTIKPMALLGNSAAISSFISSVTSGSTNQRVEICDNVSSFELLVSPDVNGTSHLLTDSYPRAFRLSFTLMQESPNGAANGRYRKFAKTIFVQQNSHF